MAGKYLDWFSAELGWREDNRRTDFRSLAKRWLKAALLAPVNRDMAGYWQGLARLTSRSSAGTLCKGWARRPTEREPAFSLRRRAPLGAWRPAASVDAPSLGPVLRIQHEQHDVQRRDFWL